MGIMTVSGCTKWLDDIVDNEKYGSGLAIELIAMLYHLNNGSTFTTFGIGNPSYFLTASYREWSKSDINNLKQGDVVVTNAANTLGHIGIARNINTTTVDLVSQMGGDCRLDTYSLTDCQVAWSPDYATKAPAISSPSSAPQGQISPRLAINWTKSTLQDIFVDPYIGIDANSFKLTTFSAGLILSDTNLTDIENVFIQNNPQFVNCSDELIDSIILDLLIQGRHDKYIGLGGQ